MSYLDMRALYYITLTAASAREGRQDEERQKAVENCLNQNFTIIAQKIAELEARVSALENAASANG